MKAIDVLMHFVVTSTASIIAKIVEYPFERVKMIVQNQQSISAIKEGKLAPYDGGIFRSIKRIIEYEGFFSLWRGNAIALTRYVPQQMLNFTFYSFFDENFHKYCTNYLSFSTQKIISGGLAGACTTLFVYPLILCQTKVATDLGSDLKGSKTKREVRGLTSCIFMVRNANGFRGLYRGMSAVLVGVCIYRSIYFSLYDIGKNIKSVDDPHNIPLSYRMVIAQIASLTSSTIAYPLDTIARRLMVDTGKPAKLREFSGMFDCTRKLYKNNGISVFFWGAKANAIRSIGGGLMLILNDEFLKLFKEKFR